MNEAPTIKSQTDGMIDGGPALRRQDGRIRPLAEAFQEFRKTRRGGQQYPKELKVQVVQLLEGGLLTSAMQHPAESE
jgi:hypothetical protein